MSGSQLAPLNGEACSVLVLFQVTYLVCFPSVCYQCVCYREGQFPTITHPLCHHYRWARVHKFTT